MRINKNLKGSNSAARPSHINNHLRVKYPLHIFDSYVQPVTQHYEWRRTVQKHLCNQSGYNKNTNDVTHPKVNGAVATNYCLRSESICYALLSAKPNQQYEFFSLSK